MLKTLFIFLGLCLLILAASYNGNAFDTCLQSHSEQTCLNTLAR